MHCFVGQRPPPPRLRRFGTAQPRTQQHAPPCCVSPALLSRDEGPPGGSLLVQYLQSVVSDVETPQERQPLERERERGKEKFIDNQKVTEGR